ncbi:uncharacterized, partial [Tachysurus ichikawai]
MAEARAAHSTAVVFLLTSHPQSDGWRQQTDVLSCISLALH